MHSIDFRGLFISHYVDHLISEKPLSESCMDFDDYELNHMTQSIITNYGANLDNMNCLRGLTDAIYTDAESMYKKKFKFFMWTFIVPFIAHFFLQAHFWVGMALLAVSALSLIILMIYDVVMI